MLRGQRQIGAAWAPPVSSASSAYGVCRAPAPVQGSPKGSARTPAAGVAAAPTTIPELGCAPAGLTTARPAVPLSAQASRPASSAADKEAAATPRTATVARVPGYQSLSTVPCVYEETPTDDRGMAVPELCLSCGAQRRGREPYRAERALRPATPGTTSDTGAPNWDTGGPTTARLVIPSA